MQPINSAFKFLHNTIMLIAGLSLSTGLLFSPSAKASPLSLYYTVTDVGTNSYYYNFYLVLDNNDGSWLSKQNFNWIIFGDSSSNSPIIDFVGDPALLPIGPFTFYSHSNGSHNGPTLIVFPTDYTYDTAGWVPNKVSDSLHWAGTSSTLVAEGQLTFSVMMGTSINNADFEVATIGSLPIPTTAWLLGSGLLGLAGVARKRKA